MLEVIFGGGLTGLVGTIWSGYNKRKQLKEEHAHELAFAKLNAANTRAEAEMNLLITESNIGGMRDIEEEKSFALSQKVGNEKLLGGTLFAKLFTQQGVASFFALPVGVLLCFLFGLADLLKGLARPAITIYLLIVSTWISKKAWDVLQSIGEPLTAVQASSLVEQVITVVLYLTTTAVTWWFGDRMNEKNPLAKKGL